MGDRHTAGLVRVVREVPLRVHRRLLRDGLDRLLVGADGAVGAEAPNQALLCA